NACQLTLASFSTTARAVVKGLSQERTIAACSALMGRCRARLYKQNARAALHPQCTSMRPHTLPLYRTLLSSNEHAGHPACHWHRARRFLLLACTGASHTFRRLVY